MVRQGRSTSRVKLGTYPAMGLAEARTAAAEALRGPSPEDASALFAELVDEFLDHGRTKRGQPLRTNTLVQYRRAMKCYTAPLQRKAVSEITRRDCSTLIGGVARQSGATTARLLRAMLARLFGYAVTVGHLEINPVTATPSYAVAKRGRILTDLELQQLWAATAEAEAHNVIVRLLLVTGCRRSEIGNLHWSELGHDGVLTIPGERIKTHNELVLPLPQLALDELARVPRVVGQARVFGPTGFQSWSRAKRALDARLNFSRPWLAHDLRRTAQTRMIGLGIHGSVVNKLLNHAMHPVEAAYDRHTYMAEKRQALQLWASELERITAQPAAQGVTHLRLK